MRQFSLVSVPVPVRARWLPTCPQLCEVPVPYLNFSSAQLCSGGGGGGEAEQTFHLKLTLPPRTPDVSLSGSQKETSSPLCVSEVARETRGCLVFHSVSLEFPYGV